MRQRFNVVFWLGMVAFVVVSSLSAWRLLQLHNEIRLRDETSVIEQKLTELYNTLLEADVTFLVLRSSQDEADMRKLLRLVRTARRHADDLSRLVDTRNVIHHEVSELHDMVIEKLGLSERLMANIDFDADEPFQKVLVIENDLLLTQKVNRKIQSIEAYLVTNLNGHRAYVDRYFSVNMLSIGAASAVSFALLLAFAGLVWSEIRRRRDLEIELRHAQQAAIQASELKSQFLATVSHEIRTPLNGIIGMSELLQQRLQGESSRFAGVIHGSGRTLLRIVSDILDFSKIEANKISVEIQEVRPAQVLETAIELFSTRISEKKLRAYCTYPRDFDQVFAADGVRISQVLHNLLGNAVKFTRQGLIEVTGRVVHHSEEQFRLRLEVHDTGPGIEAEKSELIFQPFFQIHQDFQNEGTGLGLAISKRLVEIMGGQIGMSGRQGDGSTFWFDLPLRRIKAGSEKHTPSVLKKRFVGFHLSEQDREFLKEQVVSSGGQFHDVGGGEWREPKSEFDVVVTTVVGIAQLPDTTHEVWVIGFESDSIAPKALRLTYPLSPERLRKALTHGLELSPVANETKKLSGDRHILLVEDNPTNQLLAQAQLEQLGYRVTLASNGRECLDFLAEGRFSAILMDCRMPVMDGFEVTKQIRNRELSTRSERIPIIAMTANALDDDRQRCLAAGMDDFVTKPIEIQQLNALIQKWVPDFSVSIDWRVVEDLEKKTSKATIERLFNSFRETLRTGIADLKSHSERGDWKAVGALCHQLRASAAAVGALVLSRSMARIDNMVEQEMRPSPEDISVTVGQAESVLAELSRRSS